MVYVGLQRSLVGKEEFAEQTLEEFPARTSEQARTTRRSITTKERTITPVILPKLAAQVDKSCYVYCDSSQKLHCNTQENIQGVLRITATICSQPKIRENPQNALKMRKPSRVTSERALRGERHGLIEKTSRPIPSLEVGHHSLAVRRF